MKKIIKLICIIFLSLIFIQCQKSPSPVADYRWTEERAWQWHSENGWMVGTNFNPSTSINQLEFWQEETYDRETIERELEWSAELGMNMHRVYLHNLLWDQDSIGFLERVDNYLNISESKDIKTLFVLLDDVWHPVPKLGKQPEPIPFVHNSGWVQAPGSEILGDSSRHDELKNYVKGVISHFADDKRVVGWDLYNEPDNVASSDPENLVNNINFRGLNRGPEVKEKHIYSLSLLKKTFMWAREVNPSQPLTVGLWKDSETWNDIDNLSAIDRFAISNSDVISFHAYGDLEETRKKIEDLEQFNRPLLCTEYLARGEQNTFQIMLPLFKEKEIAAVNWGFVAGKTNTAFPWSSWQVEFDSLPKIWHHDIYLPDKTPYDEKEIAFLKNILSN
ncbi:cellulase family glycosylhydrolase [Cytophagia bacterium]|nr:cellulase family glycosylhydrolase [Cytophagia bacterium]|tara:strand:+ start:618 stop:1790 length:1173 start_codon:yes stop_codon:yes gene_type:complete